MIRRMVVRWMFVLSLVFVLATLLLLPAAAIFAQAEPASTGDFLQRLAEQTRDYLAGLAALLFSLTAIPAIASATVVLTAVLKRVIPAERLSARTLALAVQVVLWAVYVVAWKAGYGPEVEKVLGVGPDVLKLVLALFGFPISTVGAAALYQGAKADETPLLGYARTPWA